MAGKIYERKKLQSLADVVSGLFTDLKAAGLTQILPASNAAFNPTSGAGKFVFESTAAINPVHTKQPYRILVDLDGASASAGRIRVAIANPQQITNNGATTSSPGATDSNGQRVYGQLGAAYSRSPSQLGDAFVTRNLANVVYDAGTTVSYQLVVADHGITFFMWEDASDANPRYSFFCVQSPVSKADGKALVNSNSPIFVVYDADNTGLKKFVLSEVDVARPTASVPADSDTTNSNAIVNSKDQVAIARGNQYLITLPSRLNTDRYVYTEELDLFAYTSADIIGETSEVPVKLYGETANRVYRAMKSNGANSSGMRLLTLVDGGGVPAA